MDSSGKSEGIVDCPFRGTIGSMAGTSVRSSMVVGRRRCVTASRAGGRAPTGTRKREIMFSSFLVRLLLLVGRARRVPGCLSSLVPPAPELRVRRLRWSEALCGCAQHQRRLPTPHVKALPMEHSAFRIQIPAADRAFSLQCAGHRAAHSPAKYTRAAEKN